MDTSFNITYTTQTKRHTKYSFTSLLKLTKNDTNIYRVSQKGYIKPSGPNTVSKNKKKSVQIFESNTNTLFKKKIFK